MKFELKTITNNLLASGLELAKAIEDSGYEAYLVGGCVRDLIRFQVKQIDHVDIHDIDIATSMPMSELDNKFRTESNNGEAHGTKLVLWNSIPFEVTHFRTDGEYSDNRHPDTINLTSSFEEDTARRDFTINSIGMKWDGTIIDFHGGVDDIEKRIIRAVGSPLRRFDEDSLRIIRGIRFSANFEYNIDDATSSAMTEKAPLVANISNERIRNEILKLDFSSASAMFNFFYELSSKKIIYHMNQFSGYTWIDVSRTINMFYDLDGITKDNIFAILSYYGTDKNIDAFAPTRKEKKLWTWYKSYVHIYQKFPPVERYWTWLVKFASSDYRIVLRLEYFNKCELPWIKDLPIAEYIAMNFDGYAKINEQVRSQGIAAGKEFGERVAQLIEEEYIKMANSFPRKVYNVIGNSKLTYTISDVHKNS